MISTRLFVAALSLALLLPVNAKADDAPTITDIVAASGGEFDKDPFDFDILLNAVLAADLADVLDDENADFTVFAPSDRAFIKLARDLGYEGNDEAEAFNTIVAALTALGGGDPIPVLTDVLLYHVSPVGKATSDLRHAPVVHTAMGETIVAARKTLLDNEPDLVDARFVGKRTDIAAANGIVHVINRVLIPVDLPNSDASALPTIAGTVILSGGGFDNNKNDFDILLNAVVAADLVAALDNPDESLTVLAPTDNAFKRTARDLGYHGDDEAGAFAHIVAVLTELGGGDPVPLLQAILLYHVTPDAQTAKQVLESASVDTLLGASFAPDVVSRELVDNEPELKDARVLTGNTSIRASNGFINPVSRVLIPVDLSTL